MSKKIFLVTGGTGGHLFPAISLMQMEKKFQYFFLIDSRIEHIIKKNKKIRYFKIQSSKIKLNLFIPIFICRIIVGIFQSLTIFYKYQPDLVIGFGGYTSIPSLIAAKIMNIKILIHEQNAIMGRTNRLLAKLTNNVAINFKNTKYAKKDSYHTGIPIRINNEKKNYSKQNKRILVIGGSQGAKVFSTIIPQIFSLLNVEIKSKIFVVQQVRTKDKKSIKETYKKIKIDCFINEFFHDIYKEYNQADLIISRCGASTLSEIELFKKPSILFPLPSAIDDHQYFNALEFSKNNYCKIFKEKDIDFLTVARQIEKSIFSKENSYKLNKSNKNDQKLSLPILVNKILQENV